MQTINATDCIERTVKIGDEELERLARTYRDSAKLRSRITFLEFCANPDLFINQYEHWPDTVWQIDFTDYGQHQKMWVNDQHSGHTLGVYLVRKDQPNAITDGLNAAAQKHGKPDAAELVSYPQGSEAIDWCHANDVSAFYCSRQRAHVEAA